MSDVSSKGVVPQRKGANAGDVLLEGDGGKASCRSTGAGEIDMINSGHAVGGDVEDALLEDVQSGLKAESGRGAGLIGSVLARRVDGIPVGFESGEEFEPG